MLVRALIVVLLTMNLGVALWWLFKPAPAAYQVPVSDAGGVELQVLPAEPVAEPGAPAPVPAADCTPAEGADAAPCPQP